jgi:primary-amine oxidase
MQTLRRIVPPFLVTTLALAVLLAAGGAGPAADEPRDPVVLGIHGGEGDLPPDLPAQEAAKYEAKLTEALKAGHRVLKAGGTSPDAVEAAIKVMEDSGLFDAGTGSVFTHDGHVELDASIMDGATKKAGAVAGVTIVKNPIAAARAVMEKSRHVLLIGRGAELFSIKQGLDIVPPDHFWNKKSWDELQEEWKKKKDPRSRSAGPGDPTVGQRHYGTVGAVALDNHGNLAAGTSTGGLTDKLPGRVGDSPIIGAGTYADNGTCAVSCTGIGEYFIRYAVAHDIAARIEYKKITAALAADEVVGKLKQIPVPAEDASPGIQGVEGGVIVLDRRGNFTARYNADQMSRATVTRSGKVTVTIIDKKADQAPPPPAAPAPAHPLDPLTADEMERSVGILRQQKDVPEGVLFPVLTLHEPPKEKVLAFHPGQAVPREAFAVVYSPKANQTWEAIVDLTANRVTRFGKIDRAQPPVLGAEYDAVMPTVRKNPEVRAALAKRQITDLDKVYFELWAGGPAQRDRPNARLGRVLCYERSDGGSGYFRPIAGLTAIVDLNDYKVLRVTDTEGPVAPVARNRDNFFDPDQVGRLRQATRPLEVVQPQGSSFTVDGHLVSWQNWSFRFAITPREGLVLYQVHYNDHGQDRPILYRASLAELVVPYGDADKTWSWRMPFDEGEYGLGVLAIPLEPGKQVPENAQLFDTLLADDHGKGTNVLRRSVAVYERDGGVLWGHTDLESKRGEWRRARELVITFMMAAGNYDYGFNWVVGQDGAIRVEVELGGIPLAKGVRADACQRCADLAGKGRAGSEGEDRYGTVVARNVVAPNHQHWFCFRLDMDVDGTANSVSELSVKRAGGRKTGAWVLDEKVLKTEREAWGDLDPTNQRHWKVFNPGERTDLGHFPGYVLEPGGNSVPLAGPKSELGRRAGFLRHHLWVTRYREGELYPAGDYPNQSEGRQGLPRIAEKNAKLTGEDVVLWYSCGVTHAPRPEDWPVMPTVRTGFRLAPHGFFTRNPALDVPGR